MIQTPTDTIQTNPDIGVLRIRGHWKKGQYLSWHDFYTCFPTDLVLIHPQTLSDRIQTPSRHHPDTIQTPPDTIKTPPDICVFIHIHRTLHIYSALYCIKVFKRLCLRVSGWCLGMSGDVWMVSGDVWMVSRWCLKLFVMYQYKIQL